MSGTTIASISEEQIAKFKQRFATGRAGEIEDANNLALAKGQEVTRLNLQLEGLKRERDIAKQNWKNAEGLRLRKRAPGDPTPRELKLKQEASDAQSAVEAAERRLTEVEGERDAALELTVKLPREAYIDQFKDIGGRLRGSGKKLDTVDARAVEEVRALLSMRNYDGVGARIAELEGRVRNAVAARDLPVLHAKLVSRITTLAKQPVNEPKVLKDLKTVLDEVDLGTPTGGTLATLEQRIEPAITAAEERVGGFVDLHARLDKEIAELKRRGAPGSDDLRLELGKCVNLAKQNLEDGTRRLKGLESHVKDADVALARQMEAKLEYPGLLDEITDRLKDFRGQSSAHVSYNLEPAARLVESAKKSFSGDDFILAIFDLTEAGTKLDEWDEKAWEQDTARSAEEKRLAAESAARETQRRLREARERAQRAAESADSASSLDAIGRNSHFERWLARVQVLTTRGIIAKRESAPYWLPGETVVEILVEVVGTGEEADFLTDFVIHYHPDGSRRNPYLSPVHAKPYPGNATTVHVDMPTSHWLFGPRVPSLTGIRENFRVR